MYYSKEVHLINPKLFSPEKHLPANEQHLKDLARLFVDVLATKHLIYPRRKCHKLHARFLQNLLGWRAQRPLRKSLMQSGVIGCREKWCAGAWSMSYWIEPEFLKCGFSKVSVDSYKLYKRVTSLKRDDWDREDNTLLALDRWVRSLEIDYDSAKQFLDKSHRRRSSFKYQRKLFSIDNLRDGDTGLVCVDEQGRAYSNLTWLWKEFRQFLSVNGERLVNLDIANSQPLFLALLLCNQQLLNVEVKKEVGILHSLYPYDTHFLSYTLTEDVYRYKQLCEEGKFYHHLMSRFNVTNKQAFKRRCFASIFYGFNERTSKAKQAFTSEFPTPAQFIFDAKAENYKALPLLIQRVESNFIIRTVCKRLTEEHPHVPLLTIHDSIMTTERYATLVKDVMLEEFTKLGTNPLIRLER